MRCSEMGRISGVGAGQSLRMAGLPAVVVDTREQEPYSWFEVETVRAKLPVGDYSLAGFEHEIAIERKELGDFIQTTIKQKSRFRKEIEKLRTYRFARIVVEGSLEDIIWRRYRSAVLPQSVFGAAAAIETNWPEIGIVWAGDRQCACRYTLFLLEHFYRRWGRRSRNTGTATPD